MHLLIECHCSSLLNRDWATCICHKMTGILIHACSVRAAAVEFVAAAARVLSPAEGYAQLLPLLQPALLEEPSSLTSEKVHL